MRRFDTRSHTKVTRSRRLRFSQGSTEYHAMHLLEHLEPVLFNCAVCFRSFSYLHIFWIANSHAAKSRMHCADRWSEELRLRRGWWSTYARSQPWHAMRSLKHHFNTAGRIALKNASNFIDSHWTVMIVICQTGMCWCEAKGFPGVYPDPYFVRTINCNQPFLISVATK